MNKEYMHNGVLFNHKKNEIMLFVGKWMEVEIIILSETNHSHKD
jgi:hypothetical protein